MLTDRRMQAVHRYLTAVRDASDGAPTSNQTNSSRKYAVICLIKSRISGETRGERRDAPWGPIRT
jgi:hypothetical protein